MFEYVKHNLILNKAKSRTEYLEGRKHIVVPTVMIKEGVWEGSHGKIYYSSAELEKSVPSWDHKPVLNYHPECADGENDCSPRIINESKIGVILNAGFGTSKLRNETWIDEDRAKKINDKILEAVEKGEKVEVSTGLKADSVKKSGIHNGKKYPHEAVNISGRHLAILHGLVGACSVKDGAGLYQNESKVKGLIDKALKLGLGKAMGFLKKNQVNNEMSYSATYRLLERAIRAKIESNGQPWMGYLEDVFSDYCVYWHDNVLYKIGYTEKDGKVSLEDEPQKVNRVTSYEVMNVSNGQNDSENPDKGDTEMSDKKKVIVDRLVSNGKFAEDHRTWLMGLDEAKLEDFEKVKPAQQQVNNNQPAPAIKPSATVQEALEAVGKLSLPEPVIEMLQESLQVRNQKRTELVKVIMADPRNTFTQDYLENRAHYSHLEALARFCEQPAQQGQPIANRQQDVLPPNYSGAAGAPIQNAGQHRQLGRPRAITAPAAKK